MIDDQQSAPEQSQGPQYPFFAPTQEGLKRLHQQLGRMVHQAIEAEILGDERGNLLRGMRAEIVRLRDQHTDGKCQPVVSENGHAEMPVEPDEPVPVRAVGRTRGG